MKKNIITLAAVLLCLSGIQPVSITAMAEAPAQTPSATVQSAETGKLYGIGSVSKVFTAAAVMKLVDDGKLNLDEPLTAYIPEFEMVDKRYVDITPRMLLNHSSGLMGMTDNNAFLMGDNDTYNHDHFLGFLKEQNLKHDPGELSVYSNDSFTLAEILVEHVSGMSFTEFIERNFSDKLGLENIKTPQSDFDRERLAAVYSGNNEMKPENLGVIGSGGIYSSMEDLCKYSTIFMDNTDGNVLSKQSVDEMAKNQHIKPIVDINADTTCHYGFGWDSINTYPFNQYGIKALSKGGGTGAYHTNLTVLPEHNLAVAVSSSGTDSKEQLIAQEIILEILREEGLIDDAKLELPDLNTTRAKIPESVKTYAGFYSLGAAGELIQVEFTNDTLIITPIGVRNERPQEYIYNTDGGFVSTNGNYISRGGLTSAQNGTRGVTTLTFSEDKYIVVQTYEVAPGLSQTAMAMPIAEKIEPNAVSSAIAQAWEARNGKEYLLVNEKYTSLRYANSGIAKINAYNRAQGYVGMGIYQGIGAPIKSAKIIDKNTAVAYQSTPTMAGRDTNNLNIETQNGVETLWINNYRYIDAATITKASEIGTSVKVSSSAVWFDVDDQTSGQSWQIKTPENGSWFTYDDKMNCVATSLEKNPRNVVILPENGRIAFVGEAGAEFQVSKK